MASDNEMKAAGIHLPAGGDYMSLGDDAISENARVLWDRIEGARFDQTAVPLGASDVFDELPTNIYTWWSGDTAEALDMPFTAQGTMIMSRWGAAGGVALAMSRALTPEVWINSRLSGGWVGWSQIGGTPEPVQQLKSAGPAGLKTAPLALTTGYGGARTSGTGTTSVIQHLPAATTRLQLRMRNWNPRYVNQDRATVTLTGVRIGRHTSGGNGTDWVNLPDGVTEYASQWIDRARRAPGRRDRRAVHLGRFGRDAVPRHRVDGRQPHGHPAAVRVARARGPLDHAGGRSVRFLDRRRRRR